MTLPQIGTVSAGILSVVGMLVLRKVCLPFDGYRALIWSAMGVGLLGCFLLLGPWFDLRIAQRVSFLVMAALMIAALGVFTAMQALFRRLDKKFGR